MPTDADDVQADRHSFRARWVFPATSAPIEGATVEITGGQIAAIHTKHDPAARDLGNAAIIPGLVNAHTHLEFSDLNEPLSPGESFTDWIRSVIDYRHRRTKPAAEIVTDGLRQSRTSGTTLLGEITTDDEAVDVLGGRQDPSVVSFREIIGLQPEDIDDHCATAQQHLLREDKHRAGIQVGLSPHAPYSVHPDLFCRLIAMAKQYRTPVAFHLAETRAEIELLERGTGPFFNLLNEWGLWREGLFPCRMQPLDYLRSLAETESALVIHGNYLGDDEVRFIAQQPNLTVVYCPRTHAHFGHELHPWQRLIEQGANVALGTDGRGSNPDLSLWNELCFLRDRFPSVHPAELLKLATLNGTRALRSRLQEIELLAAGQPADLTILSLGKATANDPYTAMFDGSSRIIATIRDGVPIFTSSDELT